MDGMNEMAFKIVDGKKGEMWINPVQKGLDLCTPMDKTLMVFFVVSAVAFFLFATGIAFFTPYTFTDVASVISAPFFMIGIIQYIRRGRWYYFIVIAVVSALLHFLLHLDMTIIFFIDFTLVGSVGVVTVVEIMQRFIFYRVVQSVEYLNVKDDLTLWDKLVSFVFSIPSDLDTRNITMDYNLKRASIPWNEIKETMSLGLMIGTFLWIYLSMNPAIMDFDSLSHAPLYLFSLVLYIPIVVMPWSIFRSLNVRVETKYRDFTIYGGIKETLKRMAIPVLAAFMFILIAVNENGIVSVLGFIVLSVIINMMIIGLTSAVYYAFFEGRIVDDIVSKWKIFRPVALMMDINDKAKKKKEFPCTPTRDTEDYGELVFTGQN